MRPSRRPAYPCEPARTPGRDGSDPRRGGRGPSATGSRPGGGGKLVGEAWQARRCACDWRDLEVVAACWPGRRGLEARTWWRVEVRAALWYYVFLSGFFSCLMMFILDFFWVKFVTFILRPWLLHWSKVEILMP
jgi:hypothetical protein